MLVLNRRIAAASASAYFGQDSSAQQSTHTRSAYIINL